LVNHSNSLEYFNDFIYYNGVLQCLVNIEPLKDIFLNRNKLSNEIINNTIITKDFYYLMQYMWNNTKDNMQNTQASIFLIDLEFLSQDLNKIKSLIEVIILSMHYEHNDHNEQKKNYDINDLKKDFLEKKYSFISDLFFFELLSDKKCCNKHLSLKSCMLVFDIDEFYNKSNGKIINTEKIISDAKMKLTCDKCNKILSSKIKFISSPKILIIVLQTEKEYDVKFEYKKQIDIKDYFLDKKNILYCKYKLISIIRNKGKKKMYKAYCNSKNIWYGYLYNDETQTQKIIEMKEDDILMSINNPFLLIYQKIEK
jgi:hypothetical protein